MRLTARPIVAGDRAQLAHLFVRPVAIAPVEPPWYLTAHEDGRVTLHDVADVAGFVAAELIRFESRTGITLDPGERDELQRDGFAIMMELAKRFEPHRAGYAEAGTFGGFAASYLPKRLGDRWHQRCENHHYVTREDGSREWSYSPAAVSLQGLEEQAPGSSEARSAAAVVHVEPGGRPGVVPGLSVAAVIRRGMLDDFDLEIDLACQIAAMKSEDKSEAEMAEYLERPLSEIKAAALRLERVCERWTQ